MHCCALRCHMHCICNHIEPHAEAAPRRLHSTLNSTTLPLQDGVHHDYLLLHGAGGSRWAQRSIYPLLFLPTPPIVTACCHHVLPAPGPTTHLPVIVSHCGARGSAAGVNCLNWTAGICSSTSQSFIVQHGTQGQAGSCLCPAPTLPNASGAARLLHGGVKRNL